jgi:protoporphyrinogen/coproporphyrinogen III oxidase
VRFWLPLDATAVKMPSCVAVLGGGITGLSAAFHLARRLPSTSRIVVLEKENRLGGWVQSKRVRVKHGSLEEDIIVESGPRTLRPNGKALLELVGLA